MSKEKENLATELKAAGKREKTLHEELEECQKLLDTLSSELEAVATEKTELIDKHERELQELKKEQTLV